MNINQYYYNYNLKIDIVNDNDIKISDPYKMENLLIILIFICHQYELKIHNLLFYTLYYHY
jgi:hypothetical protein